MIFSDIYWNEKFPNQKSKLRIDCTATTGGYNPLEAFRNKAGDLFVYISVNTYTKAGKERKADLVLSRGEHISSLYNPSLEFPYWYGDMKGTKDAFILAHHNAEFVNGGIQAGAVIELFVARGQRNNIRQLYRMVCEGELDEEMNALRKRIGKAVPEPEKGKGTLY